MKYFVNILKQFSQTQRLIVLILLLSFTTGSILISQYLKTDDCRPIIEENFKMQEDFVKIAEMLRAERLKENFILLDSSMVPEISEEPTLVVRPNVMDEIMKIADSHSGK